MIVWEPVNVGHRITWLCRLLDTSAENRAIVTALTGYLPINGEATGYVHIPLVWAGRYEQKPFWLYTLAPTKGAIHVGLVHLPGRGTPRGWPDRLVAQLRRELVHPGNFFSLVERAR